MNGLTQCYDCGIVIEKAECIDHQCPSCGGDTMWGAYVAPKKKIGSELIPSICPVTLSLQFIVQTDSTCGALKAGDLIIGFTKEPPPNLAKQTPQDALIWLRSQFFHTGFIVRRVNEIIIVSERHARPWPKCVNFYALRSKLLIENT